MLAKNVLWKAGAIAVGDIKLQRNGSLKTQATEYNSGIQATTETELDTWLCVAEWSVHHIEFIT